MSKRKKIIIFLFVLLVVIVPTISLAGGLVPCDNVSTKCDWNQFMNLINNIIRFILFDMAVPIAAIMFLFAGFELVTSGGSTEKRGMAKKVFTNALIGLVLAAACWLIVRVILDVLGYSGGWIGF